MDIIERKARFTEIVTTIELYNEDSEDTPRFPNNTQGLADGNLRSALVAHAFHEGEDFSNKLVNALMGSTVTSLSELEDREPTQDDLSALGLATSLAWAHGELRYLFNIFSVVAMLSNRYEIEYPPEMVMVFRSNKGATDFKKYNPYDLLEDKLSKEDMVDLPNNLNEILSEELGEEGLANLKKRIVEDIISKLKEGDE